MTHVFGDPETFVDDALEGFARAHRDLVRRVDGGIVRARSLTGGHVGVVVGGGSGHYPAFAGLVGPGLAAGAVCGNIFSSPSTGAGRTRIEQLGGAVLGDKTLVDALIPFDDEFRRRIDLGAGIPDAMRAAAAAAAHDTWLIHTFDPGSASAAKVALIGQIEAEEKR